MKSRYAIRECRKRLGEPFYIGINFTKFLLSGSNYIKDYMWNYHELYGKNMGNLFVYKATPTEDPYEYVVDLLLLYQRNTELSRSSF